MTTAITLPQIKTAQTHDCPPTLTDQQVYDFCRQGYLVLEAVVPDEINQRMLAYSDEYPDEHQPLELLGEDWFVDGVFKNPQAAGAVRALLGAHFKLPQNFCNHRVSCPAPADNWHRAGRLHLHHRLLHLAPPPQEYGNRLSQPHQIQLLAHRRTAPRLDH